MITRLIEWWPGEQCASTEMQEFASVKALTEWLKDVRGRGYSVRVVC